MDSRVAAVVQLLRGLVGRMPDDEVAGMRIELAERGLDEVEWTVLWRLREHGLGLTEAELALLPLIELDPDDYPVEPEGSPRPAHRFEPGVPSAGDEVFLGRARRSSELRRVVKAVRAPLGGSPATVVYVAVYAPGADLAQLQSDLSQRLEGALAEAVADGEDLPPYQAAALAAGTPVWPG